MKHKIIKNNLQKVIYKSSPIMSMLVLEHCNCSDCFFFSFFKTLKIPWYIWQLWQSDFCQHEILQTLFFNNFLQEQCKQNNLISFVITQRKQVVLCKLKFIFFIKVLKKKKKKLVLNLFCFPSQDIRLDDLWKLICTNRPKFCIFKGESFQICLK